MKQKLKDELEMVIAQCSALQAKLNESLAREKQAQSENEILRAQFAELRESISASPQPDPADGGEPATEEAPGNAEQPAAPPADTESEPADEETDEASESYGDEETESATLPERDTPGTNDPSATEPAGENDPATDALVRQAEMLCREYERQAEETQDSRKADLVRCRGELFAKEAAMIAVCPADRTGRIEQISAALVRLVRYLEKLR